MTYETSAADPDEVGYGQLLAEEWVAGLAMLVVIAAVTWGVITRYMLVTPAMWSTEVAAIGFAWMVFIGSAAVFRRGEHIAIDALVTTFPDRLHAIVQTITDVIVLLVLAVLAWLSIGLTVSTFGVPTTVLRVPQSTLYAAAAVGFSLMVVRHVQNVVARAVWKGRAAS